MTHWSVLLRQYPHSVLDDPIYLLVLAALERVGTCSMENLASLVQEEQEVVSRAVLRLHQNSLAEFTPCGVKVRPAGAELLQRAGIVTDLLNDLAETLCPEAGGSISTVKGSRVLSYRSILGDLREHFYSEYLSTISWLTGCREVFQQMATDIDKETEQPHPDATSVVGSLLRTQLLCNYSLVISRDARIRSEIVSESHMRRYLAKVNLDPAFSEMLGRWTNPRPSVGLRMFRSEIAHSQLGRSMETVEQPALLRLMSRAADILFVVKATNSPEEWTSMWRPVRTPFLRVCKSASGPRPPTEAEFTDSLLNVLFRPSDNSRTGPGAIWKWLDRPASSFDASFALYHVGNENSATLRVTDILMAEDLTHLSVLSGLNMQTLRVLTKRLSAKCSQLSRSSSTVHEYQKDELDENNRHSSPSASDRGIKH